MLKHTAPRRPPLNQTFPGLRGQLYGNHLPSLPSLHLPRQPLSSSKHSLQGNSLSASPPHHPLPPQVTYAPPPVIPPPPIHHPSAGVKEVVQCLGVVCLASLLLGLLSLVFLVGVNPSHPAPASSLVSPDELLLVHDVTLALAAFSLSLNLCCLLVCSVQLLFSVKLVRDSPDGLRTNKFLKKSALTRVFAVGGFFVSIPVFLTGLILYTFLQFHSTPAIVTSILIAVGIMFCGCAMVHNVFIWQKEKTNAVRAMAQQHQQRVAALQSREQSLSEQSRSAWHQGYMRGVTENKLYASLNEMTSPAV